MAQRDAYGKFLPGESGNPSGKPKTKRVTDALRKLMDLSPSAREKYSPNDGYEEAAKMLLESAFKGDGKFSQRVHALALIYDRIEGKADISESEADAMKGQRMIVMDMPQPPAPQVAPEKDEDKRPN
jgi:hypothetical protein